ncbi:MAG: class I SAM-dependent methyltransferase [Ferrimicrobium sp.]
MSDLDPQILSLLQQLIDRQAMMEHRIALLLDHAQQVPRFFSPGDAKHLLDLESLLAPATPLGATFVRVGGDNDGGYVMVDRGLNDTSVYNFGIGAEVTWDQAMADRGNTIYQFDHTIEEPPPVVGKTVFQRLGLGAITADGFVSLGDALRRNGDQDRDDLVLNIDIEGGEWDILPTFDEKDMTPFSQIVIELHNLLAWVHDIDFRDRVMCSLDVLNQTHQIVHVHANNYGGRGVAGSVMSYDVLEATLLRRADWKFVAHRDTLPLALDRPNAPHRDEFSLGNWGRGELLGASHGT